MNEKESYGTIRDGKVIVFKKQVDTLTLGPRIDLSGIAFFPDSFGGQFEDLDLSESNFKCSYLKGVNLNGADLRRSDLTNTTFNDCGLCGTRFYGANLQDATFHACSLDDAHFSYANLRNANFRKTSMKGVDFTGADLRGASLKNVCGLDTINITEAIFEAPNGELYAVGRGKIRDANGHGCIVGRER